MGAVCYWRGSVHAVWNMGGGDFEGGVMEWQPIYTAPENTPILCYCEDYEPYYFVGVFMWADKKEERLVSDRGNRRTYEDVVTQEREWTNDTPSFGATHWMPLPEPPNAT